MKPLVKKEKSSEELASQRPKRSTCQKNTDGNNGLLWREETDLKKALYASLQETRKKNFDDEDDEEPEEEEPKLKESANINGQVESPKKAKVHAQRKFAQGSTPTSPVPTPQKVPVHTNNSTTELIPYRRPKTEDFLTFLCLRGTSILPPSLDFLNCCSKSDSSSDCHSLSPEPDIRECTSALMKASNFREKINSKNENSNIGYSKKHTACKASSKKYPNGPLTVKKSNSKLAKEISVVKKRKSRDDCDVEFLPPNATSSSRTRASTLYALKEKYKKQRLAAGKKKLLPSKSTSASSPDKKKSLTKPSGVQGNTKKKSPNKMATRNQSKIQDAVANKLKSSNQDKKLAIEKRKSLRSAHIPKGIIARKRSSALNKKTMWLRRAKLVPPIVDVDSDSEPEIINMNSEKKSPGQKVLRSPEISKSEKVKHLGNKLSTIKVKPALTSRQILLRKHMQNRLKAKKSILHSKNFKSKAISKKSAAKQEILRKARKNMGLKTMSLRKDHQNKRVTRSAKQQIEEMLWANPEKRTRSQSSKPVSNHKPFKKRNLQDNHPIKKQKTELPEKNKINKSHKSCDNISKNKQEILNDVKKKIKLDNSTQKSISADSVRNSRKVKNSSSNEVKSSNSVKNAPSSTQTKNSTLKSKTENKIKSDTFKSKIDNSKTVQKTDAKKIEVKAKNEIHKLNEPCSSNVTSQTRENFESKSMAVANSKSVSSKMNSKLSKTVSAKTTSMSSVDAEKKAVSKNTIQIKSEAQVKKLITKEMKLSTENESKIVTSSNIHQSKLECSDSMQSNNNHNNISQAMSSKVEISSNDNINKENNLDFKVNTDISLITNTFDNSCDSKELNVQNNLNLDKICKTNDKDISKLMTLNVEGEELLNPMIPGPSTSKVIKKEINLSKKMNENKFECVKLSTSFKKHDDKKYIKKSLDFHTSKSNEKTSNKKVPCQSSESCLTNIKKCNFTSKAEFSLKNNVKKAIEKTVSRPKINTVIDSDSYSSSEELESIYNNKKIDTNKQESSKRALSGPNNVLPETYKKSSFGETSTLKNQSTCFNSASITLELTGKPFQNQEKLNKLKENEIIEKLNHSVNNSISNEIESDDSDCDLTIDQYLKLTSAVNASSTKHNSGNTLFVKKEINQDFNSLSNDTNSKHIKKENDKNQSKSLKDNHLIKKDIEKETQKSKKDSMLSKHKKDKDSSKSKSHDKSKKEEKSKKDSEKSLAKLLKKEKEKERLKSIKKEEKSKHKRDGSSSSKSSKRDFDKDGSKLKRELEKDHCSVEKLYDKKVDFIDVKKEKSSKKESSKVSRSNSYDETKSPKKKKKYNEFKDIEKIKNLISNSCILNEISGFKAFKRRLSGDKSELKKRLSKKKQKKLALLKEKKLSKKLSSKLLRKYSKKKGLKSKKSKLKKKGLKKESKSSSLSKMHSKNKKQKHKIKDHHKKDSQEKSKTLDLESTVVSKESTLLVPNTQNSFEKPIVDQSLQNVEMNTTATLSNTNVKMPTNDVGISANFLIDNVSEVIPVVDSTGVMANISKALSTDLVLNSVEPAIIATEYEGVEEGFPTGTILLDTKDNAQIPAHFMSDTLLPKTMADAATNTYEEDIEEVINSIPEHMKSDEMSVGTQTITPAGSPSPTLETRSLLPILPVQSIILNKPDDSNLNCHVSLPKKAEIWTTTSATSPSKPADLPQKLELPESSALTSISDSAPSISANVSNTPLKSSLPETVSLDKNENMSLPISPTQLSQEPLQTSNISSLSSIPPVQKKLDCTVKTELPGPSKIKKRAPTLKKQKLHDSFTFSKSESFPIDVAKMVSAPVYHPTSEEFQDPLEYISKIYPEAEQFGICKIIPPSTFKPECKVSDDLRFMALNQYLHKMLYRWGPNVQHTACIKKHLKSQKVKLEQAPLIGGIELDISKFYHTVQQFGGLQQVIEKNKWHKVADVMRVPKAAQDRVTKLYDAYCKYLVSYDTLPTEEKKKLEDDVIAEHNKYVMLRNNKDSDKEEELDEEDNIECVTKGRSMPLSNFFRIARNTMNMWFKNDHPLPEEVEHEFWKIVTERNQHIVVHAGNIDSNTSQSGFPSNKSPFAKHPWNLKVLTNNNRSILRCMGPVSGITSPTLHVGMLFTTSCWYKDPHSLPWIEYLHTGASKIWYGIPANGSEKFKNAVKKIVPEYCTEKPLWLSSESSMIPPDLLVKHGSSLSKTIQKSGQFVVIFPESFTSTICCGYCVSESVYFAPTSWLDLAEKAFQDIHESCESPAFSFERLLFSIAKDPKPQLKALQKVLPKIENIRSREINLRAQLNESGLKDIERLPISEPQEKKKKSKILIDESELECEICSAPCYLSRVIYPQEDTVYCLPHALEHIQKKNLRLCKLVYTFDEKDFNDVIVRVRDLVSTLPKESTKKKSPKKKILPISDK